MSVLQNSWCRTRWTLWCIFSSISLHSTLKHYENESKYHWSSLFCNPPSSIELKSLGWDKPQREVVGLKHLDTKQIRSQVYIVISIYYKDSISTHHRDSSTSMFTAIHYGQVTESPLGFIQQGLDEEHVFLKYIIEFHSTIFRR